jgi:hypothetical protein
MDENLMPRRNDRLAAKSVYRDLKPEKQSKRVMLSKWQLSASAPRPVPVMPDATIATRFHETFQEPLSSSKRATMRELFPMAGARRRQVATQASRAQVRLTSQALWSHILFLSYLQQCVFHSLAVPCVRVQPIAHGIMPCCDVGRVNLRTSS